MRLSVVMAVRDGEPFLREAIDSVLGQSFTDFEFLIVDDASRTRRLRFSKRTAGWIRESCCSATTPAWVRIPAPTVPSCRRAAPSSRATTRTTSRSATVSPRSLRRSSLRRTWRSSSAPLTSSTRRTSAALSAGHRTGSRASSGTFCSPTSSAPERTSCFRACSRDALSLSAPAALRRRLCPVVPAGSARPRRLSVAGRLPVSPAWRLDHQPRRPSSSIAASRRSGRRSSRWTLGPDIPLDEAVELSRFWLVEGASLTVSLRRIAATLTRLRHAFLAYVDRRYGAPDRDVLEAQLDDEFVERLGYWLARSIESHDARAVSDLLRVAGVEGRIMGASGNALRHASGAALRRLTKHRRAEQERRTT